MGIVNFDCLVGQKLERVDINSNTNFVTFYCKSGGVFQMYHEQECCEGVYLENVDPKELKSILNSKIVLAEESSQIGEDNNGTWTFYKIVTKKGFITLRWYGESNGYYSETVDFSCIAVPAWESIDMWDVDAVNNYKAMERAVKRGW